MSVGRSDWRERWFGWLCEPVPRWHALIAVAGFACGLLIGKVI